MELPTEITFRHMEPSPAVEARVREEAAALTRYYQRIVSCRVIIDAPHHHRKQGCGYHVGIVVSVPGKDIVVNHEPSLQHHGRDDSPAAADHADVYVAIRDSFAAVRRQLQDHARIMRGDFKSRETELETI